MRNNKKRVFDFIIQFSRTFMEVGEEIPKLETRFLSEQLNLQRTNVSSVLNQLVEEGKLQKTKGRPVLYYLSDDQRVFFNKPFYATLIGAETSLKEVIQLTRAAITYPLRIRRLLYVGEKGVGISTLADRSFDYACSQHVLKHNAHYLIMDCSSYSEAELKERLTGEETIFDEGKDGFILLEHCECLSPALVTTVTQKLKNSSDSFVLLLHVSDEAYVNRFKDQTNFIVRIPSLKDRSLEERYQFVEKFFHDEAMRLNRSIEVNYGLMQCLMLFPCQDNLIELHNSIQFGVANALSNIRNQDTIHLELSNLPINVRKGLLYIRDNRSRLDQILDRQACYVFSASETKRYKSKAVPTDIYALIDDSIKRDSRASQSGDESALIFANIEDHIATYLTRMTIDMNEDKLRRINSDKLYFLVKDFMTDASTRFNRVYANETFYGICLHLNNAIIKTPKQRLPHEQVISLIERYDKVYIFTRQFIKSIEREFNVQLSLDDSIIIMLMLATEHQKAAEHSEVVTLIAMHGHQTATAIVELVESLMPVHLYSFELPIHEDIDAAYQRLKETVVSINQGRGILVFYDMGSIAIMLHSIMEETKIDIRMIDIPLPLLALSSCRYGEEGRNLDNIYQMVINDFGQPYSRIYNRDIVITVSSVEESSSEAIKRYLQTLEDYRDYQILSFNVIDHHHLMKKIDEIKIRGHVVGIVGTFNPEIFNIKYRDYHHLPNVTSIHELFADINDDFDILTFMLEQFDSFELDDLKRLFLPLMNDLETIFHDTFGEDLRFGLMIHMGCLIDRLCKHQGSPINFNDEAVKTHYPDYFQKVSDALRPLEEAYQVSFSDGDRAKIVEIILNARKEHTL